MKEFDSICPNGYYPVTLGKGYCVCRRVVESTCPKGWYRDSYSCRCNFRSFPSCPDYTTLTKYGAPDKCTGSTNATCPPGYELLDNCSCVAHVPRICEGGEIAADGCSCKVKTEPLCRGYQCTLNTETCYCQQRYSDPYSEKLFISYVANISFNFRLKIYLPLQPATQRSIVGVIVQHSILSRSVVMATGNPINIKDDVTTGEYAYWCTNMRQSMYHFYFSTTAKIEIHLFKTMLDSEHFKPYITV